MAETCFCHTGLNWFKQRFKPPLAETCEPDDRSYCIPHDQTIKVTFNKGHSVSNHPKFMKLETRPSVVSLSAAAYGSLTTNIHSGHRRSTNS